MHGLMRGKRAKPSNLLYKFLSNKKHFVQDAYLAEKKIIALRYRLGAKVCVERTLFYFSESELQKEDTRKQGSIFTFFLYCNLKSNIVI